MIRGSDSKAPIHHRSGGASRDRIGWASLTGIGIGGIIGAGYFLGSGIVIRQAGPSVVVTYIIGALIMAQVMGGLSSMAMANPQVTVYRTYIAQYLGTYAGFLLGWAVLISGVIGLGSEAVATATYARYWISWPLAISSVGFTVLAMAANLFGTRWIGKLETGMSVIKVAVILGFAAVAAMALTGHVAHRGGVVHAQAAASGLMPHGIEGTLAATLVVVFSYSGVTTVAMATGRTRKPGRDIPRAATATVVGVALLYILGIVMLLWVMPWSQASVKVSPFSEALGRMSLPGAEPIFTMAILIASFSVMAGGLFATVWMLVNLANARQAPGLFAGDRVRMSRLTLTVVGAGVVASILAAFTLPKSAYTDLTAASSYFSFLNWSLILWSFIRWAGMKRNLQHRIIGLAFAYPYGAIGAGVAIIALTLDSATVAAFRPGLWVFLATVAIISVVYLLMVRRKPAAQH